MMIWTSFRAGGFSERFITSPSPSPAAMSSLDRLLPQPTSLTSSWDDERPQQANWPRRPRPMDNKRGVHRERDGTRDENKHGHKTKRDQNFALERYVQ
jgi:hypothetical protein